MYRAVKKKLFYKMQSGIVKKVSDTVDNNQRVCYYNISIIPY